MGADSFRLVDEPAAVHAASIQPDKNAARRLPPLYYLRNFRLALDSLRDRYAELLSPEEIGFIEAFAALPESSQCLLTRLVMRKGPFFRRSTLHYDEIQDLPAALATLVAQRWVELDPVISPAELQAILDRAELRLVFGVSATVKFRPANEQLALPLPEEAIAARPLSRWHSGLHGRFMALLVGSLVRRLRLLFFGNDHQDWAEFVLTDLGTFRYESVPLEPGSRAFQSRVEIEHFYRLNECRERLRAGEAASAVRVSAFVPDVGCAWLSARFMRLQLRVGEHLEAEGELDLALETYRATRSVDGLVKAVRLQERLGQHPAARCDALAAWAQLCTEAQREALERALLRLERRLEQKVIPVPVRPKPDVLELSLPRPVMGQRVERSVAAQLSCDAAPVFYVENGLLTSLFGLLCWEALFAPVPGAFFHPFQAGPRTCTRRNSAGGARLYSTPC